MKLYLFTIGLCSLFIFPSQAQDTDTRKFKFGIKGMTSLGWNKTDNEQMENVGTGFALGYGLMAEKRFQKNYALAFGFDIMNQKNKIRFTSDAVPTITQDALGEDSTIFSTGRSIYTYNYGMVNLPVSLKMMTNEIGYITYFAQFGLELGMRYRTTANIQYKNLADEDLFAQNDEDIQDQTSFFRAGLNVGGGFEWNLTGNTNLLIGLNYHNGFSNILGRKYTDVNGRKVDNNTLILNNNDNLNYDDQGNVVFDGERKKAAARYVALTVGIYF